MRRIPRRLARAPIPLFRAGLGGAFAGGLRAGDPLPSDISERVPLVRIVTVPR